MATNLGIPVSENDYYFISYNTEDADRVSKIVQLMHQHNIPMWYDRGIQYGDEWEEEIATHVTLSRAVIIFLTKGMFQKDKPYVEIEYKMAKRRKRPIYYIFMDEIEDDMVPNSMLHWFIEIDSIQNISHTLVNDSEVLIEEIIRMLGPTLNPVEQNTIGNDYFYGLNGIKQNYEEAVKWYRRAAEQGYDDAQYNLGYCYKKEKGVAKNYKEAMKWYQKAASQGCAAAQFAIGYSYYQEEGVKRSYEEAVKWYLKSAENGYAPGQYNLATCYEQGKGVKKKDLEEAKKWYQKAANQGHEMSKKRLKILMNNK